jgi:hypothetical protein
MKPAEISEIKRGNMQKIRLKSLQQAIRIRMSETCVEE